METINVNQNNYYGQPEKRGQFAKGQVSLLTKSMLIGGIGFIVLCVLSGLLAWAFSFAEYLIITPFAPLWFFLGFFLLSMLISMLWMKILYKGKSVGLTILVFSLYLSVMSVCFGFLFCMLGWGNIGFSIKYICIAFGIVGIIFLLVCLVAKVISLKGIITYTKIVSVTSIIAGIVMLGFLITAIVVGCTGHAGDEGFVITSEVITWFLFAFIALVTFLYITIDVKSIMKLSQFTSNTSDIVPSGVIWYCGFKLLSDLANVLLLVILLLFNIRRRI